jgi:hypothetical protein
MKYSDMNKEKEEEKEKDNEINEKENENENEKERISYINKNLNEKYKKEKEKEEKSKMILLKKEKEKEKKLIKLKEIFNKHLKIKYTNKLKNAKTKKNLFEENQFILLKSKLRRIVRKIKRFSRKNANEKFYYNKLRKNLVNNLSFPLYKEKNNIDKINNNNNNNNIKNISNLINKNSNIEKTEEQEFTLSSIVLLLYEKINKKIKSIYTSNSKNNNAIFNTNDNSDKFPLSNKKSNKINLNKNIYLNLNILTTKETLDNSLILKDFLMSAFNESKNSSNVKIEDGNNTVKIMANLKFCNDYYEENFTIKFNIDIILTIILLDKIDNISNYILENEFILKKFSYCLILFDVKKSNENNLIKLESIIKASTNIRGKSSSDLIKFNKKIFLMKGKDSFGYEEFEYSKNFLNHLKRSYDVINTYSNSMKNNINNNTDLNLGLSLSFINKNEINNIYYKSIMKKNIQQMNNFFNEFVEFDEYPQYKIITYNNFIEFLWNKVSDIFFNNNIYSKIFISELDNNNNDNDNNNFDYKKRFNLNLNFLQTEQINKENNNENNENKIFDKKINKINFKENNRNELSYFIDNNNNINYPNWISFFLLVRFSFIYLFHN